MEMVGGDGITLPIFDGEYGGRAAPKKGPLDEAIEKVNEMFKAKGVDVSPESVSGFITTFWGFLDASEEAAAMDVALFVCQSGMALVGMAATELVPHVRAAGLVSFMAEVGVEDRLIVY